MVSRLVQPGFSSGEAAFLLSKYVPDREDDNFQIWIGAERKGNNLPNWHYLEKPNPGDFADGQVGQWGKNQPDDKTTPGICQCGLAMARLKTWPAIGFHDSDVTVQANVICETILGAVTPPPPKATVAVGQSSCFEYDTNYKGNDLLFVSQGR